MDYQPSSPAPKVPITTVRRQPGKRLRSLPALQRRMDLLLAVPQSLTQRMTALHRNTAVGSIWAQDYDNLELAIRRLEVKAP